MRSYVCCLGAVLAALVPSVAVASLDGAGSIMYIPVVAQTASYTSQITIRNPYSATLSVHVFYTGGTGTTGAGHQACATADVPASSTIQFSVGAQCGLPAGSQFGVLTLVEAEAFPEPFQAYSRTQTPGGNGFSVPAYPAGAIEAPTYGHHVLGLKRQAASPTYQTNCFVASTDDATPYQILLLDANGNQLGNPITGSLTSYQMVRFLDVFAAAGLPPGDYSNVTAQFSAGASTAALLSFCTVQESTFFGADFRMAQPVETMDGTRQRDQIVTGNPHFYVLAGTMTTHDISIRHPDRIRCLITSANASILEIRLLDPNLNVVAGGNNVSDTGTYVTTTRAQYGGYSGLWHLDVSPRETYAGPFPVFYDLACFTGNGSGMTVIPQSQPDAF